MKGHLYTLVTAWILCIPLNALTLGNFSINKPISVTKDVSVTLSWSNSLGATSYEITLGTGYNSASQSCTGVFLTSSSASLSKSISVNRAGPFNVCVKALASGVSKVASNNGLALNAKLSIVECVPKGTELVDNFSSFTSVSNRASLKAMCWDPAKGSFNGKSYSYDPALGLYDSNKVVCAKADFDAGKCSQLNDPSACPLSLSINSGPWTNGQSSHAEYLNQACVQNCTTANCETYNSTFKLYRRTFIVDGLGVVINYNKASNAPTLVYQTSATGSMMEGGFADWYRSIFNDSLLEKLQVVYIRWNTGIGLDEYSAEGLKVKAGPASAILGLMAGTGWVTRKSTELGGTSVSQKSARLKELILKIHSEIHNSGQKFMTMGCSGGAFSTAFVHAYYHNEIDPILDRQFFGGGPVIEGKKSCTGKLVNGKMEGIPGQTQDSNAANPAPNIPYSALGLFFDYLDNTPPANSISCTKWGGGGKGAVDMASDPLANWNWRSGYDQVISVAIPPQELSTTAKEAYDAGTWLDNSDAAKLSGGIAFQVEAFTNRVNTPNSSSTATVKGSHCFGDTYRMLCQRLRDYLQASYPTRNFKADCAQFTGTSKMLMEDGDDGVIDASILSEE